MSFPICYNVHTHAMGNEEARRRTGQLPPFEALVGVLLLINGALLLLINPRFKCDLCEGLVACVNCTVVGIALGNVPIWIGAGVYFGCMANKCCRTRAENL